MPRVAALLGRHAGVRHRGVVAQDTFVRPIYAGNALATVQSKDKIKIITVRGTAFFAGRGGGRLGRDRGGRRRRLEPGCPRIRPGQELSKSERPELTSGDGSSSRAGAACRSGDNFHLLEARRRQAGRCCWRFARRGRCRLRTQRLPGRPDRQDRRPRALHRRRHLRRDPASGGDEGFKSDRRHQQGRGGADLLRSPITALSATSSKSCLSSTPSWRKRPQK